MHRPTLQGPSKALGRGCSQVTDSTVDFRVTATVVGSNNHNLIGRAKPPVSTMISGEYIY
jgi:hypothetical protein